MQNLMTYINPSKTFGEDYIQLVKVQIDNCRQMKWDDKDILLVTNFPYSYEGINALVVPDELFCMHRKRASKINVICHLLDRGIIKDVCWFHDFDAYQVDAFPENVIGGFDAGFVDYTTTDMWNTGSFFFKPSAKSIFEAVKRVMDGSRTNEEIALKYLTDRNIDEINKRYIKLNNTYNLGRMRQNEYTYSISDKPIKVFHFHPRMKELYEEVKPLLPDHLIKIMAAHGY